MASIYFSMKKHFHFSSHPSTLPTKQLPFHVSATKNLNFPLQHPCCSMVVRCAQPSRDFVLKVAKGNGSAWTADDDDKDRVQKPMESSDTVNCLCFVSDVPAENNTHNPKPPLVSDVLAENVSSPNPKSPLEKFFNFLGGLTKPVLMNLFIVVTSLVGFVIGFILLAVSPLPYDSFKQKYESVKWAFSFIKDSQSFFKFFYEIIDRYEKQKKEKLEEEKKKNEDQEAMKKNEEEAKKDDQQKKKQ